MTDVILLMIFVRLLFQLILSLIVVLMLIELGVLSSDFYFTAFLGHA